MIKFDGDGVVTESLWDPGGLAARLDPQGETTESLHGRVDGRIHGVITVRCAGPGDQAPLLQIINGNKIAFVSANPSVRLDVAALSGFCRECLAAHKCPVEIRVLEELPQTATGKITRNTLRDAASGDCRGRHPK